MNISLINICSSTLLCFLLLSSSPVIARIRHDSCAHSISSSHTGNTPAVPSLDNQDIAHAVAQFHGHSGQSGSAPIVVKKEKVEPVHPAPSTLSAALETRPRSNHHAEKPKHNGGKSRRRRR
ncbi:hypothetical protein DFJ73DRAFT_784742 [Zopfochytrium polystomum]|nr:hypothetical protein DFJ73DRAFT_784742 [Zopfochytrium polystomum]